jgi:hypothetical protein
MQNQRKVVLDPGRGESLFVQAYSPAGRSRSQQVPPAVGRDRSERF